MKGWQKCRCFFSQALYCTVSLSQPWHLTVTYIKEEGCETPKIYCQSPGIPFYLKSNRRSSHVNKSEFFLDSAELDFGCYIFPNVLSSRCLGFHLYSFLARTAMPTKNAANFSSVSKLQKSLLKTLGKLNENGRGCYLWIFQSKNDRSSVFRTRNIFAFLQVLSNSRGKNDTRTWCWKKIHYP